MMELRDKLRTEVRPPPPEDLAEAFVNFFRSKKATALAVEDIQAQCALETFLHLQKTYTEVDDFGLPSEELRMALKTLKSVGSNKLNYNAFKELAKALFQELEKRNKERTDDQEPGGDFYQDLLPFIQIMARLDDALYARDLIETYWEKCLKPMRPSIFPQILKGLIRENRSNELHKTIEIMQKYGIPFDHKVHQVITEYYATQQADFEMTKKWYQYPISNGGRPTDHTDAAVLKLCISQDELEWGDPIFKSLMERIPEEKAPWDMILQWAAAQGKSVDEVEHMMEVMVRRQEERRLKLSLDMETINGLIELANLRNDPYSAERYVALGQKWGFSPNARTFLLQLDYRIKVKDLGGARAAYGRLQAEESVNNEDLPLVNKLIVALCGEKTQNYDAIMGLVEDLGDRKGRFESETVAALSLLHLQRGEMEDFVDLINTHAFHYGLDQRAKISDVLIAYILNLTNPIPRAWVTYNTLQQTFPEIDTSTRTSLMKCFFTRGRSDMATHVFGHMRQQQIKTLRPTTSTYVACLSGIAKAGDLDSLITVRNMMKLDTEVEPTTQLNNAFILAYTGCGKSATAQSFWEDIVHSREGPTYASIQLALMSCEDAPSGEEVARDIWKRLKRFEIEVTREIYAAYVGALAGHNLFGECVQLINDAEKEAKYKPDALL